MKMYLYQSFLYSKRIVYPFYLMSLMLLSFQILAQEVVKRSQYQAVVNLQDGQKRKGMLFKVNEASIELIESVKDTRDTIGSQTFDIIEIKSITIRKKGSSGLGFAIGATIGGVMGTLIIFSSYPGTYDVTPAIVAGAITLGGGLLGASHFGKKTFKIEGDQKLFDQAKEKLRKCQLKFE